MKRLVLAGAGHAYALVLRAWALQSIPEVEVVVISPEPLAPCSGTQPGLAPAPRRAGRRRSWLCADRFSQGTLTLTWQALVPRRIALLQIPQLRVSFCYVGVDEVRRHQIQRRFDLATQRGGG
jgi:hypothetical protein